MKEWKQNTDWDSSNNSNNHDKQNYINKIKYEIGPNMTDFFGKQYISTHRRRFDSFINRRGNNQITVYIINELQKLIYSYEINV